ncbi:hypothetical protein, partial [Shewanella sp. Sh95]
YKLLEAFESTAQFAFDSHCNRARFRCLPCQWMRIIGSETFCASAFLTKPAEWTNNQQIFKYWVDMLQFFSLGLVSLAYVERMCRKFYRSNSLKKGRFKTFTYIDEYVRCRETVQE